MTFGRIRVVKNPRTRGILETCTWHTDAKLVTQGVVLIMRNVGARSGSGCEASYAGHTRRFVGRTRVRLKTLILELYHIYKHNVEPPSSFKISPHPLKP